MARVEKSRDDILMQSAEVIGWALGGIEREIAQTRERLAMLTRQAATLRSKIGARGRRRGGGASAAAAPWSPAEPAAARTPGRKRRVRISAEGRRRIAEAMKKRWAEYRKNKAKNA